MHKRYRAIAELRIEKRRDENSFEKHLVEVKIHHSNQNREEHLFNWVLKRFLLKRCKNRNVRNDKIILYGERTNM